MADEFIGRGEVLGLCIAVEELHQLLHDVVLYQPVDVEDDRLLAGDDDMALDDVEAFVRTQQTGDQRAVGFI